MQSVSKRMNVEQRQREQESVAVGNLPARNNVRRVR
jgi:hypothetical protein